MPLPPKDDPTRPMFVAIRSMMVAGIVVLSWGIVLGGSMLIMLLRETISGRNLLGLAVGLAFAGGGALLVVSALQLARWRRRAIISGIVGAGVMLAMSVAGVIWVFYLRGATALAHVLPILCIGAFAGMIVLLLRSFEIIRCYSKPGARGFEPLMVDPAAPPVPAPKATDIPVPGATTQPNGDSDASASDPKLQPNGDSDAPTTQG